MASVRKVGKTWRVETYRLGARHSRVFKTEALARSFAHLSENRAIGIREQGQLLKDHKIISYLPERFLSALNAANYSADEILLCAMPASNNIGIYFLINSGKIRYVGQTINIHHRIDQHRRGGREFDSYSFIPCEREQLNELERIYRDLIMPPENRY